jgi:hypothetical protein
MVSFNQQKMRLVLSVLMWMVLFLVSGGSVALADGEEPFEGTIEKIETIDPDDAGISAPEIFGKPYTHTITVRLSAQTLSTPIVTLLINADTRVVIRTTSGVDGVPVQRLEAGSFVRIKPTTLPSKDILADRVEIIERAGR